MKQSKRSWWLIAAAVLLALWLLFWYLPRPLPGVNWPVVRVETRLWYEGEEYGVRLSAQSLEEVLRECEVHPAFSSDYFPYQLDRAPLNFRFFDSKDRPWEIVAGPDWVVANSGDGVVWPIVNGKELWPVLEHMVLSSSLLD